MIDYSAKTNPVWFAMSATFGRSVKVKDALDKKNVRCYVPMQWRVVEHGGIKAKKYLPVISNLIFVNAVWSELLAIKSAIPWLQMQTFPMQGRNIPIIVPDKQMEDFIRITQNRDRQLDYFNPKDINIEKGRRVRVIGGPFDNVEGIFVNVRGRGKKRLIIEIPHLMAVRFEIERYDLLELLN